MLPTPLRPDGSAPTPPTLNHVIGQRNVIDKLKVALDASFADDQPFPHTLLLGSPGTGKTTIAKLLSSRFNLELFDEPVIVANRHITSLEPIIEAATAN